jgi:Ca2+-binding RTX toxin-like protein
MGNHIDALEPRRLFASTPTVILDGNVLRIGGTDTSDDIAIAAGRVQFQVHANGHVQTFNTADVRLIRVFGKAGDDSIIVSPRLGIRCSIEGNDGNDRIGGSARNDTIMGGRGEDTIVGNGGDDYVDAGADDDVIDNQSGLNVIHGGGGTDRVTGGRTFLGSGVEDPDPRPGETVNVSLGSELTRINGRLILSHFGWLPQLSDQDSQSGPTRLTNGQYEVVSESTIYGIGGAILGSFDHSWDITDQAASGVVLTYRSADVASTYPNPPVMETIYSLPFLLPTR